MSDGSSTSWFKPSHGLKRTLVGLAAAAAIAGVAVATPKPNTTTLQTGSITVQAQTIAGFDRTDRSLRSHGKLKWLGGVVLTSPSDVFGGWSGLAIDADGERILAVSDAGTWMSATIAYDKESPSGLNDVRIGPLLGKGGTPLGSRFRDAEALVLTSGTVREGSLLIAFEGKGRIGRFSVRNGEVGPPTSTLKMPPEFGRSKLDGFEAVTQLKGGALNGATLAIAERLLTKHGDHAGWIWAGKDPKPFALSDIGGFDITDLAALPNGDVLVLERRFRWSEGVKMRLRQVASTEIKPGAVARGEVLLEADMNQEIDNMEGLAVHPGSSGDTIVTMISDNNFNRVLQRTVLLQFALPGDTAQAASQ